MLLAQRRQDPALGYAEVLLGNRLRVMNGGRLPKRLVTTEVHGEHGQRVERLLPRPRLPSPGGRRRCPAPQRRATGETAWLFIGGTFSAASTRRYGGARGPGHATGFGDTRDLGLPPVPGPVLVPRPAGRPSNFRASSMYGTRQGRGPSWVSSVTVQNHGVVVLPAEAPLPRPPGRSTPSPATRRGSCTRSSSWNAPQAPAQPADGCWSGCCAPRLADRDGVRGSTPEMRKYRMTCLLFAPFPLTPSHRAVSPNRAGCLVKAPFGATTGRRRRTTAAVYISDSAAHPTHRAGDLPSCSC